MPMWKCPVWKCMVSALAPPTKPVHKIAPNPNFQAKDPHCPEHGCDLVWTPDEVQQAPTVDMGTVTAASGKTVDLTQGILVATFNGTIPIYCDMHQRKHIYKGRWPGSVSPDKPLFKAGLFDHSNLGLGVLMATSVPWIRLKSLGSGADVVFSCGKSVVGEEGEMDILLQGGFSTSSRITFHAYPVVEDSKRKPAYDTARKNGLFLPLDISKIRQL